MLALFFYVSVLQLSLLVATGPVPKYARLNRDIETVWQRPRQKKPKGVFFIAHGCNHQGTDIFSNVGHDGWVFEECQQSNLGSCLGLPEEVSLRQAARDRGYVVVAVSGGSGHRSCWDYERDLPRVQQAIQYVMKAEGLPSSTPVLATGASSGGMLMSYLAEPLKSGGLPNLQCVVVQIAPMKTGHNRGVATLFVHMPRDKRTAVAVQKNIVDLRSRGIWADEFQVHPLPVTLQLLQRCLGANAAQDVMHTLIENRMLDASKFLKDRPGPQNWSSLVKRVVTNSSIKEQDESCIAEIMALAYAEHEFTAMYSYQMIDFCEKQGSEHAAKGAGVGNYNGGHSAHDYVRKKGEESDEQKDANNGTAKDVAKEHGAKSSGEDNAGKGIREKEKDGDSHDADESSGKKEDEDDDEEEEGGGNSTAKDTEEDEEDEKEDDKEEEDEGKHNNDTDDAKDNEKDAEKEGQKEGQGKNEHEDAEKNDEKEEKEEDEKNYDEDNDKGSGKDQEKVGREKGKNEDAEKKDAKGEEGKSDDDDDDDDDEEDEKDSEKDEGNEGQGKETDKDTKNIDEKEKEHDDEDNRGEHEDEKDEDTEEDDKRNKDDEDKDREESESKKGQDEKPEKNEEVEGKDKDEDARDQKEQHAATKNAKHKQGSYHEAQHHSKNEQLGSLRNTDTSGKSDGGGSSAVWLVLVLLILLPLGLFVYRRKFVPGVLTHSRAPATIYGGPLE